MFYKASIYIADILEQQKKFMSEDKELYRYGIQKGLNLALNILTTMIIGCLCGMFYSSVLFLLSYMPLRSKNAFSLLYLFCCNDYLYPFGCEISHF